MAKPSGYIAGGESFVVGESVPRVRSNAILDQFGDVAGPAGSVQAPGSVVGQSMLTVAATSLWDRSQARAKGQIGTTVNPWLAA